MGFFAGEIETMSRKDIEAVQLRRLKDVVARCYYNVPFYRERLDAAGITPDRITALSDIREGGFYA